MSAFFWFLIREQQDVKRDMLGFYKGCLLKPTFNFISEDIKTSIGYIEVVFAEHSSGCNVFNHAKLTLTCILKGEKLKKDKLGFKFLDIPDFSSMSSLFTNNGKLMV